MIRTQTVYWYECDSCHESSPREDSNVEATEAAKFWGWTFTNGVHSCGCSGEARVRATPVAPPPQKKLKELKRKPAPLFGDDL